MLIFITAIIVFIISLSIAIKVKNDGVFILSGVLVGCSFIAAMGALISYCHTSANLKADTIQWRNNHDILIYQLEEIDDMTPAMTLDLFNKINEYNIKYDTTMEYDKSLWFKGLTEARAIRRAGVGRIEIIRYMEDNKNDCNRYFSYVYDN